MNSKAKISVIIPCYNCENTIKRCVDSLYHQTGPDFEIVLVDDGSTDNTADLCDYYANTNHGIVVVHQENKGLVGAWKTGVKHASGNYIGFCDSDDYIDEGFIESVTSHITIHYPDMIVFGMKKEYDNGEVVCSDVLLQDGYYDKKKIKELILPRLFSDGDMQTELMLCSRCNKVFTKELLLDIISDIPEKIALGEDCLTCFAATLNSNSILCIRNYYPYHYVRTTESMIGAYDERAFAKIEELYTSLKYVSDKYDYLYPEQIEKECLSSLLLYMKKEICKNPQGYRDVSRNLKSICNSELFNKLYDKNSVNRYSLVNRVYAKLIYLRFFPLVYCIVRVLDSIKGRKV